MVNPVTLSYNNLYRGEERRGFAMKRWKELNLTNKLLMMLR
jgi:hypothetical protein